MIEDWRTPAATNEHASDENEHAQHQPGEMHGEELSRMAADFVAGDLREEEEDAFSALAAQSPSLQREVEFWQRLAEPLRAQGRPAARPPGAGFNEVLRRRLEREGPVRPRSRLSFPGWFPGISLALAAGLMIFVGLTLWSAGSLAGAGNAHSNANSTAVNGIDQAAMGMSSLPIEFSRSDGAQVTGLQVVRVNSDGTAHRLGIRPGDVVVAVDDQEVRCPWSFAKALAECGPNDVRKVTVFRPAAEKSINYHIRHEMVSR